MEDLITLVNELNNRGVSFHSLEENITMHKSKKNDSYSRNGYDKKVLKTTKGDIVINTPRNRNPSFSPELI